jgi:hypothetical protein
MKIDVVIEDRDGTPLEIGDTVELFDWVCVKVSLGTTVISWDPDEGRVSCLPCLIDDANDFWTKALPRCRKVNVT